MDSFIFKLKTDESILNFPVPAVIITEQGDILWNNDSLELMFKGINKQKFLENIIKELDEEYDDRFAEIDKEINIHDKHYRILGNLVNLKKRNGKETGCRADRARQTQEREKQPPGGGKEAHSGDHCEKSQR